jgi:hypothetical protein
MTPNENHGPPPEDIKLLIEGVSALRSFSPLDPKSRRRGRVDAIWRAIDARIMCDEDAARWMEIVASGVVKNVIDKTDEPENRPKRALAALQLSGREERHCSDWQILESAIQVIGRWAHSDQYAPQSPAQRAKALMVWGHFDGLTKRQAADKVRKWRGKNS